MCKKVFISGKVSGLKRETARRNFLKAEKYLKNLGYEPVNPIRLCRKEWSWVKCMVKCIYTLTRCKSIFMTPNWKDSRGARLEHAIARLLGKEIMYSK